MPAKEAEQARALLIELSPNGFEERDLPGGLELAAYADAVGELRLREAFPRAWSEAVEPGWEERWRDFHRPVAVNRIWIGAPWHEADPTLLAVVVDPGRAFGTGAHATTRLCLELLQELDPASLLDVGCGSGVIGLAAARLGFAPVLAIDVDAAAIDETLRNAAANGVALEARLVDAEAGELPEAAVTVANVSLAVLERVAPRLRTDVLVASGYLAQDVLAPHGFRHVERRERENWAADVFVRE